MTIKLQFVDSSSIYDMAIRAYSHSWPCHVDAVMPDGRLLGAQSSEMAGVPAGVQIRPADYYTWEKSQVITLNATPDQEKSFWDFLNAQIGCSYNWPSILAFAIGMDVTEKGEWFCSELIAAALEKCSFFDKPLSTPPEQITPGALLLIVSPWDVTP
jgi:hypothetical protein